MCVISSKSPFLISNSNLQSNSGFCSSTCHVTEVNVFVQVFQPQELIPVHPVWNVADWDAPKGAIDWPRLVTFLQKVKVNGEIPPDHRSHDHLNEQKDVPVREDVQKRWIERFETLDKNMQAKGEKVVWGLVDGFLLYWHPVSPDVGFLE